jgi:hypothetical protein
VTYCAGGGTPTYPACLCPTCAVTYCAGGGTPTYPACLCPTPIGCGVCLSPKRCVGSTCI